MIMTMLCCILQGPTATKYSLKMMKVLPLFSVKPIILIALLEETGKIS